MRLWTRHVYAYFVLGFVVYMELIQLDVCVLHPNHRNHPNFLTAIASTQLRRKQRHNIKSHANTRSICVHVNRTHQMHQTCALWDSYVLWYVLFITIVRDTFATHAIHTLGEWCWRRMSTLITLCMCFLLLKLRSTVSWYANYVRIVCFVFVDDVHGPHRLPTTQTTTIFYCLGCRYEI